MARMPRKFQQAPSACYHVMNRGHNREAVFADAADCHYFLELVGRYQKRFPGLRLFHYCQREGTVSTNASFNDIAGMEPQCAE